MSQYTADHAGALADIREAGAAVTFTTSSPGTYDAATDAFTTPVTSSVTGAAVQISGKPFKYQALGLIASHAPTLLFAPTTYGQLPALGASVTWGSATYTVRDVESVALDGTAIIAYVVVAQ